MTDKYVEKAFLYLIALSVLLHVALFGLVLLFPPEKPKPAREPTMVDLTDLPEPPPTPPGHNKRSIDRSRRVARETSRNGSQETERLPRQLARTIQPGKAQAPPAQSAAPIRQEQQSRTPQAGSKPVTRGEGLFRPKAEAGPERAALFPSAGKMARIEESYRKKYGPEVEDGETKFLDTDDIRFGSFLRRFETAVYGVWHYPEAAARRGIEGVTPVKITFNRAGEIVKVTLLESSGSQILDEEVLRSLKQLGPIGSFPKGYRKETFNLIGFFQYRMGGGRLM